MLCSFTHPSQFTRKEVEKVGTNEVVSQLCIHVLMRRKEGRKNVHVCAILLDFLEEFQNNNIIFMCVRSDSYTFSTMQSYSYFLPNILLCVYTVYIIYVQYMYMCVYTGIYIHEGSFPHTRSTRGCYG